MEIILKLQHFFHNSLSERKSYERSLIGESIWI